MQSGAFSPEEDAEIRRLRNTKSPAEIAAAIGRTAASVRNRIWYLGMGPALGAPWNDKVPWSSEDLDLLRSAYCGASSGEAIRLDRLARRLGRDKANVCRKARELGLTNNRRPKLSQPELPVRPFSPEELAARMSKRQKRWIAEHGHPRGALGMKHSEETRRKLGESSRRMWADPNSKINSPEASQRRSDEIHRRQVEGKMNRGGWNSFTRGSGGRRADLGDTYFRSSWEANYARYLNFMVKQGHVVRWEYEAKTFVFEAVKRGTRSYTPDFLVVWADGRSEWHEVKGWMDPQSRVRLDRMAKYYPDEKVVVIGVEWFKQARRQLAYVVPGWEYSAKRKQS